MREKRPNLTTKISNTWTKKVSLDVTDFHVMLHILSLQSSRRSDLLSLLNEKIHGFPDLPSGLLNLLAKVSNEKYCLRDQFWYFVQASSPLFTDDQKQFDLKKRSEFMHKFQKEHPNSNIKHILVRMCINDGLDGKKMSAIFGVTFQELKMSALSSIDKQLIIKRDEREECG